MFSSLLAGSEEKRGITAWQAEQKVNGDIIYDKESKLYLPGIPKAILKHSFVKHVPFFAACRKKDKRQVISCDNDFMMTVIKIRIKCVFVFMHYLFKS